MAAASTGASFTAVMFSWKVSEAESDPSLAVTLRSRTPLKFAGGVPEKVLVVASKLSQLGRPAPSLSLAVSASMVLSTSAKVPAGTTKLHAVSSGEAWSAMGARRTGASFAFVTVTNTDLLWVNAPSEAMTSMS